jgi:phosphoribosylformylglycinamidine synthase
MFTTLFDSGAKAYIAESLEPLAPSYISRLEWYLGAKQVTAESLQGPFVGPRAEMVSPWSSNAVSCVQVPGVTRVEEFKKVTEIFDEMVQACYKTITLTTLQLRQEPEKVVLITDIDEYNRLVGLAFNPAEVDYLNHLSKLLSRPLSDAELYAFSQANSEHCRHKLFNALFIINGQEKPHSLFELIRLTTSSNPGLVQVAYTDNSAAFGRSGDQAQVLVPNGAGILHAATKRVFTIIKVETHNHPTTVAPFEGAATGVGGDLRDLYAIGTGSWALALTAAYLVSALRLRGEPGARDYIYQTPTDILIKGSNGASDYCNKIGKPLINGSTLAFELSHGETLWGYDKTIMLAGGLGTVVQDNAHKGKPRPGQLIVLLGGPNYRIGMGGASASSVSLGDNAKKLELDSVQRPDPKMQKGVADVIEACSKLPRNPIVSVHDHGAGGHANCLLELVEQAGGVIYLNRLPLGDPTLSPREILSNESQERMGLLIEPEDWELLESIARRESCPIYNVGEITGDGKFVVVDETTGDRPFDLKIDDIIGNPPRMVIYDKTPHYQYTPLTYKTDPDSIRSYLTKVLHDLAVGSKEFLTSKADRSVGGQVAQQQCVGPFQVPVSNYGLTTWSIGSKEGTIEGQGLAPVAGLIDAGTGARLATSEALLNIIWAPLDNGLHGVSLSANWMSASSIAGENARLYEAVEDAVNFIIQLGANGPTGKDSTHILQKYPDGSKVVGPLTVIMSAFANVTDVRKRVTPALKPLPDTSLIRIDFSCDRLKLGGSSFAYAALGELGNEAPNVLDPFYFAKAYAAVQKLITDGLVVAGHDTSSGLAVALLEMMFASGNRVVPQVSLDAIDETDVVKILFAENPALVMQVHNRALRQLRGAYIEYEVLSEDLTRWPLCFKIKRRGETVLAGEADQLLYEWYDTSLRLEAYQTNKPQADLRRHNLGNQPLQFSFPNSWRKPGYHSESSGVRAATIRIDGSNGEKEMQFALHTAGFDVKDITMTDLEAGREDLTDVQLIVFVGGFANSDVLGAAKGWAGAFKFGKKAKTALKNFLTRPDTLSLGICNGCQLMVRLGVITPQRRKYQPQMLANDSGRFESAFVNVEIPASPSVMLQGLTDLRLGVWVAHGEGKFSLPGGVERYNVALRYSYSQYPGNPNGSVDDVAAIVSDDGRHLAMMPHPERCLVPHNWGHYPDNRPNDQWAPWIDMFIQALVWCQEHQQV